MKCCHQLSIDVLDSLSVIDFLFNKSRIMKTRDISTEIITKAFPCKEGLSKSLFPATAEVPFTLFVNFTVKLGQVIQAHKQHAIIIEIIR